MKLTQNETKKFIEVAIGHPEVEARNVLYLKLRQANLTEAQFCAGVIEHGPSIQLTNEQWFDFFTKVPNILFEHVPALMNKLTENQRKQLKFE